MRKNKGFTLIELLAVIILLVALSTLIYFSIMKLIERQKRNTYTQTLNGIVESATVYATENKYSFVPNGEDIIYDAINDEYLIDLKSDLIKMNVSGQLKEGWVIIKADTTIEVKNVYNGVYCAVSGTTGNFVIKKSPC